jgi:hypothetical protein
VHPDTSCEKEAVVLRALRPLPAIQLQIDQFAQQHDFTKITSVHVRMGQPELPAEDISDYSAKCKAAIEHWRTASHWETFAKEMKKLLISSPWMQFFVAADRSEIIDHLKEAVGTSKVITQVRDVFDRSQKQMVQAVVDIKLLAMSLLLLGSQWSSFTEVAHFLQPKNGKLLLAGVDF